MPLNLPASSPSLRHDGRNLLVALKATARRQAPYLAVAVGAPPVALLRPVSMTRGELNPDDVRRLTEWRNRFVKTAFLSDFTATEERTSRWLVEEIGPRDDKILFMCDDLAGRTFGHVGIGYIDWDESTGEADAIVRGDDAPPGTMKKCLLTLLHWAKTHLRLTTLNVRVRSDNPAVGFYEKCGFVEMKRVPLRPTHKPDMVRWIEDPECENAEASLVYLQWRGDVGSP